MTRRPWYFEFPIRLRDCIGVLLFGLDGWVDFDNTYARKEMIDCGRRRTWRP